MAGLALQQARGIFTKAYTQLYTENIPAPSFLKSFFPSKAYTAATINIEVSRGTERIAVDVLRGTRGNRNSFSRSTEKEFLPPFYKEYFDATNLDNYDRMFGQSDTVVNAQIVGMLSRNVADKYLELRKKIERAKEFQSSQALETGVVTLVNGDSIDYKRKAGSLVDLATKWNDETAPIEKDLINAAEFIRNEGKNGTPIFNLILSGQSWIDIKNSNYFDKVANFRQVQLIDVKMPVKQSFGAGFMGQITAGAYIFNVWTYDEVYENSDGNIQRFWPASKAVVLPTEGLRFEMSHAAVPAIIRDKSQAEFREFIGRISGEYYRTNHIDKNAMAHYFFLMSAAVALPISIDMIYTMQVSDGENPEVG